MTWLVKAWSWLKRAGKWIGLAVSVVASAGVALLWRAWRRQKARADAAERRAEAEAARHEALASEARAAQAAADEADAARAVLTAYAHDARERIAHDGETIARLRSAAERWDAEMTPEGDE